MWLGKEQKEKEKEQGAVEMDRGSLHLKFNLYLNWDLKY